MLRLALPIAVLIAAVSALGLSQTLGAHPQWAVKTGLIGSALGLAASLALCKHPKVGLTLGLIALVLAIAAATQGKALFAASYAENTLAGRFWFFGWIAIPAAATLLISSLAARIPWQRR